MYMISDIMSFLFPLVIKASVLLYGPSAVSYTHLDVYKRQLFY